MFRPNRPYSWKYHKLDIRITGGFAFLDLRKGWGTAVAEWLRCCATNRKVALSIPAGDTGIFHWHKIFPIALWLWDRLSL